MSGTLVLDWGIGGLPTLTRLMELAPTLSITYLSDSGHPPYGRVSRAALGARLEQIAAHFEPSALIVACNAAVYWQTLRTAGIDDKISGFGRLLADH